MLLSDLVAGAPAAGLELHVAFLKDIDGSPARERLIQRGLRPVHARGTRLHDPRGLARVMRLIRGLRPDILHTHLGYADLVGGTAARLLGVPVVSTIHVMSWEHTGRDAVKTRMMAAARRRADRVIAVSDAARTHYVASGWDVPGHVVTLRNGIADGVRPGAGRQVRAELGLAPDDLVLTMLTVLREGKGHDVAAAAVEDLRGRFPRLRLVVLGDGPSRFEIERRLARLGDAALLAGHRDDVADVLDATDILVHPTSIDALPTALMEAMAASVPSIATRVGGVPELVEDGVNGVLIEPPPNRVALARALEPLLADQAARRAMGARGRVRFEREFTAERWAWRLRDLYEDTLSERERRPSSRASSTSLAT